MKVYGNLSDILNMVNEKDHTKLKDKSFSDSEMKFSDNVSHSEFSSKHERRSSGNYMNTDFRNYVKDAHQYSFTSTEDQNKLRDKLNTSKDSEMLNERLNKFEILKDKPDENKGPVMAMTDNNILPFPDESPVGRKSEVLKPNTNLEDYMSPDEPKVDKDDLKDFLKAKVLEAQKQNEQDEGKDIDDNDGQNKDSDELVAFPSDDENSRKIKDQVLNDMGSVDETSNKPKSEVEIEYSIKDKSDQSKSDNGTIEMIDQMGVNDINDGIEIAEGSRSGRNSEPIDETVINMPKNNQPNNDVKTARVEAQAIDGIFDSVIDDKQSNEDFGSEGVSEVPSSVYPIDNAISPDDILIESTRSHIPKIDPEKVIEEAQMVDDQGFTDEDHKVNKSFKASDSQQEDSIPEKPLSPDVEGIPKIEHVTESDDVSESKPYSI